MTLYNQFILTRTKPFNQENTETDTQWDYTVDGNNLVLRFDETRSKRDWLDNFDFLRVPYRNMKPRFRVHRGFLRKYKSIRSEIHAVITDNNIQRVQIYGFSQGGALATLAHEDIWFHFENLREGAENLTTYVFGSPRVVSWFAPAQRWHHLFRIENGNDPVTKIPFPFFGYKHVGTPLHFGHQKRWFLFRVNDHYPNSYSDSLKNSNT